MKTEYSAHSFDRWRRKSRRTRHGGRMEPELFACDLCARVGTEAAATGLYAPPNGWRALQWQLCRRCAVQLKADADGTLEALERKLLCATEDV